MNKNTYEDHLKYIKMIELGYSIDYICKHRSISHKDLEVLWHRYQKDGPSGLVKKVRRLKDGKMSNKPSDFWGSLQKEPSPLSPRNNGYAKIGKKLIFAPIITNSLLIYANQNNLPSPQDHSN